MSETEDERDGDLERLRAALYTPDASPDAAERYRAALARSAPQPQPVPDGVPDDAACPETAAADEPPSRPTHRRRTALVAGAALLAAAGAAVLLAPRPAPEVADAPLQVGRALWSGHGMTGASAPVLDGRGGPVLVRLRCRGQGNLLLSVDGTVRMLACTPARSVEDDQYFDGPHDRFLLTLSLVGHPSWTASVHRVRVSG